MALLNHHINMAQCHKREMFMNTSRTPVVGSEKLLPTPAQKSPCLLDQNGSSPLLDEINVAAKHCLQSKNEVIPMKKKVENKTTTDKASELQAHAEIGIPETADMQSEKSEPVKLVLDQNHDGNCIAANVGFDGESDSSFDESESRIAIYSKMMAAQHIAQFAPVVLKKGNIFRSGSGGLRDKTQDMRVIEEAYEEDADLNPCLVTGTPSGIGVLALSVPRYADGNLLNPTAAIKKFLQGTNVDISSLVIGNLVTSASNIEFHLYFRIGSQVLYSKQAIRPGLDFYGEHECAPLPTSTYAVGNAYMMWEYKDANRRAFDPEFNPLANIKPLPREIALLIDCDTPFDEVRKGSVSLQAAQRRFIKGFSGENAREAFHNGLCHLRAFGVEKSAYFDYVDNAVSKSSSDITSAWAKSCAWHVWKRYRPINNIATVEYGISALEDSMKDSLVY